MITCSHFVPVGMRSTVITVSVCLFVCLSQKPHVKISPNFCTCYRSLVLRWWQCDTLCTSGFVDDVIVPNDVADHAYVSSSLPGRGTGCVICLLRLHRVFFSESFVLLLLFITGPPNGPVLFCTLSSVGVCRLSSSSVGVVCRL